MREFLKGLELDSEQINSIMAEHGKLITEAKGKVQELEDKVKAYETKIGELEAMSQDNEKVSQELEALKKQIADEQEAKRVEEEEKILNNNINTVFGDKKFTSEYARVGLMNDIKNGLKKPENNGKGIQEIFNELTKDKTDIFVSENQVLNDMEGMQDSEENTEKAETQMFW